ncbi:MAG: hypothetical protein Q8N42_02020 [bacterium]|nr:hypothetical protein [bacterium]
MEATTCKHKEQVTQGGDGIELGTCGDCGQTIQYDGSKNPTVTKLGRLGDKLVLPNPGYKLLLNPRDQQDLSTVDKAPPPLGVEVPPKPKTGGMHAVKRYYDENRDAILLDLDTLGEKAMCERWWKMSQVTFLGLMARWRPDYPGIPSWARDKAKRVKDTLAGIKTVPPRLAKRSNLDEYLEENKEAIIQDYQALPLGKFYAKWHIFSNRWTQLKKKWEVPAKVHRARPRMKREAAPSLATTQRRRTQPPSDIKSLPEFPPFNNRWQSSVQEKWLETYLELSKIGRVA